MYYHASRIIGATMMTLVTSYQLIVLVAQPSLANLFWLIAFFALAVFLGINFEQLKDGENDN